MKGFKCVIKCIRYHAKVVAKGFAKTMYGACVAGLLGIAAYGFAMIPSEGGYMAVCDFIGATATMVIALGAMYFFGCTKKKGAKR